METLTATMIPDLFSHFQSQEQLKRVALSDGAQPLPSTAPTVQARVKMGREDKTRIHRGSILPALHVTSGISSCKSSFSTPIKVETRLVVQQQQQCKPPPTRHLSVYSQPAV